MMLPTWSHNFCLTYRSDMGFYDKCMENLQYQWVIYILYKHPYWRTGSNLKKI